MRVRKYEHITSIFQSLNLLPVSRRIEYEVFLLTYQCIHGNAPIYLKEFLTPQIAACTQRFTAPILHRSSAPSDLLQRTNTHYWLICIILTFSLLLPISTVHLSIKLLFCPRILPAAIITLQPKTGCPLKLSRVEPGQYLDGRPSVKTRLLLEEVLVRPAGGAYPAVCVGPNTPV